MSQSLQISDVSLVSFIEIIILDQLSKFLMFLCVPHKGFPELTDFLTGFILTAETKM